MSSVSNNPVLIRFDEVSFAYNEKRVILDEASCSIRQNTKIALMGQNGAGKSTMFKLINGELSPQEGKINISPGTTIAVSKQVLDRNILHLSVKEYFQTAFPSDEIDYQLDRKIADVLKVVNFTAPITKELKGFSGGQQARLLLAHALIQHPDILLLDEPTNNLDAAGIGDLITFLLTYDKTVIVISHDADFLNLFTDGVLYLNSHRHEIEQYRGTYYDALEQVATQIEKDQAQNARAEKKIADAKEKINFFANKGGKMRKIASKLRDEVEEAEENKVDVRKEDKTIGSFVLEFDNYVGPIITINTVKLMTAEHELVTRKLPLVLKKHDRYLLVGPNGIGKTTLLKRLIMIHRHKDQLYKAYQKEIQRTDTNMIQRIAEPDTYHPEQDEAMIHDGVRVGYYSQDFNALDMDMLVWDALHEASDMVTDEIVYRIASQFLLRGDLLKNEVGYLSEGQKGLLCYARFVIQQPHLLILDEPTNHINFRHLPIIAESLNAYQGAMLIVSHDQGFIDQLSGMQTVDLGKLV